MTENVVLTGPLSPVNLASLLSGRDRKLAESIPGYRGATIDELVKALVERGVQVEAVTEAVEVGECMDLQGHRLRVLIAPMRPRPRDHILDLYRLERRGLLALLRKTEGRLINAHWTYEFAWAALESGRPVLVTARDAPMTVLWYSRDAYRMLRAIMAWIVRVRTHDLSAVSPYLATSWRNQMRFRGPIAVIPNIAPASAAQSRDNGQRPRGALVAIGNSGRIKNMRALVIALGLLRAQGHHTMLEMIGEGLGPDDPFAVETRARGVAEGIDFRGRVGREEVAEALARNSIFVHASLEESFGNVLVEAMSAGLPVVAGIRSGAVPWVLANGHAGVLVDVRRASEIARGIARLLGDEDEARALAERARHHAARRFNPDVVCDAYLAEYDRLRRRH